MSGLAFVRLLLRNRPLAAVMGLASSTRVRSLRARLCHAEIPSAQRHLDPRLDAQLALDVGHVDRGRLGADEQGRADVRVGHALSDEAEDFDLPLRQLAMAQGR